MGHKTYSLSAVAVAAAASLSFSSADSAVASAQDVQAMPQTDIAQPAQEAVEIVPQQPVFVSEEVVQPLEETSAYDNATDNQATSLRELVGKVETADKLSEQMHCLAGAVYFESRGEPLDGQLAVAQVVINRSEDRRWPASYCGVVYQRAQFSFVRGGRMPQINKSSDAWKRAKAVAKIAHEGMWQSEASDAVYFHANYVRPGWSRRKTRLAQIDTHIFYR
ncbi:cell wall hydrolase [Erythrobacter sp. KY5]|uniref:cell wall hydrolase n=1 Tax=Erythrobacter sp. KY5 TaxID=2011159 RepID=UPI000DBF30BC|nr:cell wall hydrolase [Erythrobacter sp. KY5]AWW73222.1 cell wall hydrolase [Erythrobacter sp. KY5]